MNLSRRSFIKAIIASSAAIVLPTLTSCSAKKEVKEKITISELNDYQLALLETDNQSTPMFVTKKGVTHEKEYYALKLNDNEIVKYSFYNYGKKELEQKFKLTGNINSFKDFFDITCIESAINSVVCVIGLKEEYTSAELKRTLEEVKKSLTIETKKVLTK